MKNRRLAEGRARVGAIGDAVSCAVSEASIGAVDLGGDKQSAGCKAGTIGAMLNPKGLTQHIIKRFGRGAARAGDEPAKRTVTALTREQDAGLRAALRDPNKFHHVFDNPGHKLGPLVHELAGREAVLREAISRCRARRRGSLK